MTDRSVIVRLRAEVGQYIANLEKAKAATTQFGREISGQGKTARADIEKVGRGALIMSAGLATGLGLSAKAAIDWESAWAGVTKTVDGSASQMADLEDGLRDLAKTLPATHGEIAAVAEAAGQLGIKRESIESFTKTMIDLGETTNLTADQAATSMARMANIMQTPQADIERLGSTLVALGNAGASTESEILDMAMRIAGSAKQVGISEAATLGFANALSSVGVEAEAGGTAISRVFSTIASAVAEGGESLDGFAQVAGMSSQAYAAAFEEDAASATVAFIEGLSGIDAAGGNVFATLQDLELGDIRVRDALLRAAGAGDLFRESLALGSEEFERNNALQTEAEKRYETTAAKLEVARNNAVDLAIDIGGVLLPAVAGAAEGAVDLAHGFGELPGPLKVAGVGLAGVTTGVLGVAGTISVMGPKIDSLVTSLGKMGGLGTALGQNLASVSAYVTVAAAAVTAYSVALGQQARKQEEAEAAAVLYTDAIREQGSAMGDLSEKTAAEALLAGDLGTTLRSAEADVAVMVDAIHEQGSALDDMDQQWARYQEGAFASQAATSDMSQDMWALTRVLDEAGVSGSTFGDELISLWQSGALTRAEMGQLLDILGDQGVAYGMGAAEAENLAAAEESVGGAADRSTPKLGNLADALGMNAEQAEEARNQFEDLLDAYRAAVDPLFGMLDALDQNRGAQQALTEALAANRDELDDNNVSVEELDALYRDVAATALDVEVASRELAAAVADGTVSVDQGRAMLAEWVAQGLITADQAANVAGQFDAAAGAADLFAGDYVANAYANTDAAKSALDELIARMRIISNGTSMVITGGSALARELHGAHGGYVPGGLQSIYRAGGGPSGTDTIPAWLSPGEYVMQASAVSTIGMPLLDALNAGQLSALSGISGTGGNDRSVHIGQLVVHTADRPKAWLDELHWRIGGV